MAMGLDFYGHSAAAHHVREADISDQGFFLFFGALLKSDSQNCADLEKAKKSYFLFLVHFSGRRGALLASHKKA